MLKRGEIFTVAGMEFIAFPNEDGTVDAVTKECLFDSMFGNSNNNFTESIILKKLKEEFLPKITMAIGEENVLAHDVDLTTLDGLKPYPTLTTKVSIPTFNFYRKNVDVFDAHKVDDWWWLATADSAQPHFNPTWVTCVSPVGFIYNDYYNSNNGVRPFLRFASPIFVSHEVKTHNAER